MSRILKYLTVITLFVFFSVGMFGLNLTMKTDSHGRMSNCSLMGDKSNPCQMTLKDHVAQWQQIFTATLSWSLTPLLLLAAAFVIGSITLFKNIEPMFLQLHQRYKMQNPMLKLFDYLLLAFSKGILHSQIYA